MNVSQTIELMKKAGWTAQQFMDSLNSTARAEAQSAYLRTKRMPDVVPQIDLDTAQQFFASGKGINGPAYEILEKWAERRTGYSNIVGSVFDPPSEKRILATCSSPTVLPGPDDIELAQEVVELKEITNQHARKMALGENTNR